MDGGAWWAGAHEVAKSWARLKQLSMHAHMIKMDVMDEEIGNLKKIWGS